MTSVAQSPRNSIEGVSMSTLTTSVNQISGFIWGPYLLIPLLLLTGFYLTVRLRGIQFRELWYSLYLALVVRKEKDAKGDISHFQALMTALAATVGTGNIVGVATAIPVFIGHTQIAIGADGADLTKNQAKRITSLADMTGFT